jgi:nucleoside-diphosphate-sugar epimerase
MKSMTAGQADNRENGARAARRAGAKRFIFLSSIRAQCGPTADTVQCEEVEPRPTGRRRDRTSRR